MSTGTFPWLKGHGTENDFVLLPDPDGSIHGDLDAALVRFLCDRYAGIGADGVLRVIEGSKQSYVDDGGDWFMDYRNADGSVAEMCGNGIRVFVRYLLDEGLTGDKPLRVGTRAGVKEVALNDDGTLTVDMGEPALPGPAGIVVEANGHQWPHDVNMRVHERGSGETRSCGTGTCAVTVASARAAHQELPVTYRVGVLGGSVTVTWREDNHIELTGPAVVHARGVFDRAWIPV